MKPLVYYCRWHQARLRLRGRDENAVWGELAYADESRQRFHFQLKTRHLTLGVGAEATTVRLDEMGVVQEEKR